MSESKKLKSKNARSLKQITNTGLLEIKDDFSFLELEFSQELEFDSELSFPVKDYGFIDFFPSSEEKGFLLRLQLASHILEDAKIRELEKTRLLPNGKKMSRYIKKDLVYKKI